MQTGTVKFYDAIKGFGFITPESGDKDVFVHKSGCIDRIQEGDKVQYDTETGPKGINACHVKRG